MRATPLPTATSRVDQAVARLAASRLRVACVLTDALARESFEALAPMPLATTRDALLGWIGHCALSVLQDWLQRHPWRAAGAAALVGAGLAGWMARPLKRTAGDCPGVFR
ncbi:hypothetical protein [Sphaerotilus mobilis]|uniref:Uncharacterized protein n=1 Tax=Sphaerotilus mobilis TaxID=47994 RepID=A0A4Q7LBG5_9BURK|nr:hypothetical protein [Sphaerotilus mobilis]RZS46751.1 hypothetical protein EV685_4008 [Sphaerotilus mobilis]